MNAPTRDTARRAFWLASLIVPGWAQLMAGRATFFAWFVSALLAWACVVAALIHRPAFVAVAFPVAVALHALCARSAIRLCRG